MKFFEKPQGETTGEGDQIDPKISYNISLWTDCTIQYHQDSCCWYHRTSEANRHEKQLKYPGVYVSLLIIGDKNFESKSKLQIVFKASSQTHWKFEIEILFDQFSSWNYKKTLEVTNISSMTSSHLAKMCVHFWDLPF